MNINIATQTVGVVALTGGTATEMDIRKFNHFAWTFETTADLTEDAIIRVEAAMPSDADPCVPGDFEPVEAIATCEGLMEGEELATFIIPEGTPAGTVCAGTIPCRPGVFVRLLPVSGADNISAVGLRQGPRM